MYRRVVNFIYILILILSTFNIIVKSDITNENELNSLWWIAVQYGFAWDLSPGKVCSNKGIVCDSTLKTVKSLTLNSTIPLGTVIPPGTTSTTLFPLTTATANSIGSTSTTSTSSYTIGTSGSSTTSSLSSTTYDPTTTSGYTIGTSGSTTTSYDPTTTSGYTIGTSGSTTSYDPTTTTSGYTIGTSGSTTSYDPTTTTSGYTIGTSGSTTSYDPTTTTSGYTIGTSGSTTSYDPTTTTSGYTIGTSGSTTSYDPTTTTSGYTIGTSGQISAAGVTTSTSISTEILPEIDLVDFSSNFFSRKLQSITNQPSISFLDLQNLTSLIINGVSTNSVNILDYINQMTGLEFIEITNIQNLNTFPDLFLFYCPKVSTLIVRNVPATHLSDVFFTKTDGPLTNIILDFPILRFDWSETNSVNTLFLRLNNNSYINIDGYTWQKLKQLTIYTEAPISMINMNNITSVSIFCTNPSAYVPFEFTDSLMGSLKFEKCGVVDSGLSFTGTNLTSLVFLDGSLSYSTPIANLPPNLEIFDVEFSGLSKLKSNINIDLKQLIIPFNMVSGQLPSFTQLQKVNASSNLLSGSVPSTFCSTPYIDLSLNKFISIPDCFKCHWNSITSHWLSGNENDLTPNSTFVCDFILDISSFNVLSVGETLEITGENLGWQTPSTTPGLNMVIPNSKFTFDFPPKPALLTSTTNRILQFTPDQSVSIEWSYYNLEILKVEFIQYPNRLTLNLTGTFDQNGIVYINNSPFTSPLFHLHEFITIELPTAFKEGPIEIFIKSTKVSSPIVKQTFKRAFPIISSSSIVTPTNNQLTIYGKFYNSTGATTPTVSINNQNCVVQSSSNSEIVVNAPTFSQGGYAPITINDNGFSISSSKIVYYEKPKPNQCSPSCENGGTCFEGQCSCVGDYYGPACSFKKPAENTYSLVTDQTQPQATYSLSSVEFEFSLSSIQELDFNDYPVQEIKINNWEYKEDKTNQLGVASIYYSNHSNVIISVSVVVPTTSVKYEFAGITMNLEKDQVKVSLNISGWQYQSSLNTLRAVFISTSKTSNTPEVENQCKSITNGTIDSQTDSSNSLLSFTLTRNGGILFGSFIDRMISNGRVAISKVVDMGTIDSVSYVGINMPQCDQCILDPNYAVLVDPQFSTNDDGGDGCGDTNSRSWVIPVAVVIPIVAVTVLAVAGYVLFKKRFYVYRDGKTFKFSKRRKSKSKFSMDHLG
ncbi:hypothetical protein ACTFIV_001835 [Dictyostelium citrinum]